MLIAQTNSKAFDDTRFLGDNPDGGDFVDVQVPAAYYDTASGADGCLDMPGNDGCAGGQVQAAPVGAVVNAATAIGAGVGTIRNWHTVTYFLDGTLPSNAVSVATLSYTCPSLTAVYCTDGSAGPPAVAARQQHRFEQDRRRLHAVQHEPVRQGAIRSLIISSRLGTNEFAVIHHTDCGMLTFTNQQLQEKLAAEAGVDASGIDFLPFADLRQSVADDVHRILDTPQLDDAIAVSGYIYDVHSGALEWSCRRRHGRPRRNEAHPARAWQRPKGRCLAQPSGHSRRGVAARWRQAPRSALPGTGVFERYERTSGLYLIRCGWAASSPSRRRRSASYSS